MVTAFSPSPLFIGIDVGTSGCRAIAINDDANEVARADAPLPEPRREGAAVEQDPEAWWQALATALDALLGRIDRACVRALAVDGTSGTVLVTDAAGKLLAPALLYNDNRAVAEAQRIRALAPRDSAAHGTSSGLAKLMWLLSRHPEAARVHTPADWLAARLTGSSGTSDSNNVMKLGWDPVTRKWPGWLAQCVPPALLPKVVDPGTTLGALCPSMAERFHLPADTLVAAGTTDSTAAILATGACEIGDAVTSLGSTLVMKVIAAQSLFAPEYGVYSQPLGEHWLVGGGSNSGGAVLRYFFTEKELAALEPRLDPEHPTGLDYYPLLSPGERFPLSDPAFAPRLDPRPADDARFLQGLIEGMAQIETQGYRRLERLGAPYPARLFTAGGGSRNAAWARIRSRRLAVPMETARSTDAAYGTALLALRCRR